MPELPGDLLLLFIPPDNEDWYCELGRMRFEWVSVEPQPLIDQLPKGVRPYGGSEWYGVIHRTYDYPDIIESVMRLNINQPNDLAIINGTKIGGMPHIIQEEYVYNSDPTRVVPISTFKIKAKASQSRFLCQLTSIQAAPQLPYPWTNHKDELSLEFNDSGIYGDNNECIFGDMGSIYIFMELSCKCYATWDCY